MLDTLKKFWETESIGIQETMESSNEDSFITDLSLAIFFKQGYSASAIVTPLCLEFKDILESIRGACINDQGIDCIQFKHLSDDARDVHITFSPAAVCALFSQYQSLLC